MRGYDPDLPLFSIHIPKCAGTSLTFVLRKWFKGRLYTHYPDPKTGTLPMHRNLNEGVSWKRRLLKRKAYPRGICIHGHFSHRGGYGIQDYYPEARQFITVLREPFDAAVSNYFFIKSRGDDWFLKGERWNITTTYPNVSDYIERVLFYKPSRMLDYLPFEFAPETFAAEVDKSFVYIGIAEDMQESLKQLAERLGFAIPEVVRKNKSEWDEPVPLGAREEYRKKNPHVYMLYDFACAHYLD